MSESSQVGRRPFYIKVKDTATSHNFDATTQMFVEAWPGVWAREGPLSLTIGDNLVKPSVLRPRGHIITYRDGPAVIYDKSSKVDANGMWTLNASAAVNIRIAWY